MERQTRAGRLSTGDRYLDGVLRGGVPRGGLTLIVGPTGSGKGVLAHQLCRAAQQAVVMVAPGRPAAAVAGRYAEPRPRYVDLLPALDSGGLGPSIDQIRAELAQGADLVVVDPLQGLVPLARDPADWQVWLHRLTEALYEYGAAGVGVFQPSLADPLTRAQEAASAVIELRRGEGARPRVLLVRKYEGSDYAGGEHPYRLSALGLLFEDGAAAMPLPALLSDLGARLLSAFRTARRSTAAELTELLGLDLPAVEGALAMLADNGYLTLVQADGGEHVYSLPGAG
ncbi:MAG: AAA family ATPase [Armatimonadetes bacterium]|nr:AAA family ATPase [Armatimonadota bacterium]